MVDLPEDVFRELNVFLPSCWNHANPWISSGTPTPPGLAALFDVLIQHQDFWDIAFVIAVPTTLADPAHIANEIVRFSRNTDKMVGGVHAWWPSPSAIIMYKARLLIRTVFPFFLPQ